MRQSKSSIQYGINLKVQRPHMMLTVPISEENKPSLVKDKISILSTYTHTYTPPTHIHSINSARTGAE